MEYHVYRRVVHRFHVHLPHGHARVHLSVWPSCIGGLMCDMVYEIAFKAVIYGVVGACTLCGDGSGWVRVCEGGVWSTYCEGVA